jgi:hypothetical protein
MKRYLFELHCVNETVYHHEMFECDADAQIRARKILNDSKRDGVGFMISLYSKNKAGDWHHIVSYQ